MIVDLFCGGGGASLGIKWATGRCPDLAVNHSAAAIEMHAANHPRTIHLETDVFEVQPRRTVKRREVELLWASPDCTHFSRAKGKAPRSAKIRSLAWVIVEWAREVQPRIIAMENVPEFVTWGPLDDEGQPIKERAGELFRAFVDALTLAGYKVEWRTLRACDYGAPTTRERFFLVARCDGEPIAWPAPTHGSPKARLRDPSLLPWRTAAECIDWSIPACSIFATRDEAKAWAKAHGVGVPVRPLAEATQARIAEGIRRYVLTSPSPFIVRGPGAPTLVTNTSGHPGARADAPLRTVTTGGHHALVTAWLAKHYGGVVGHEVTRPLGTVTAVDHHSVVAAHLTKFHGTSTGSLPSDPLGTVTGQGLHHGLVTAELGDPGEGARRCAAFLLKYYQEGGQWSDPRDPMHTIVTKARMGLVTVELDGEPYAIVDITLRMLKARELATAQGFPADYVLTGTAEEQIGRIGNSVPPQLVEAVVRANLGERVAQRRAA